MKMIYVASPYRGDVKKNMAFAKEACKYVLSEGNNFYCPHLFLTDILDDDIQIERDIGIALGKDTMLRCDELWVFGDRISEGMLGEIEFARNNGIPTQRHISFEYQPTIKPQGFDRCLC